MYQKQTGLVPATHTPFDSEGNLLLSSIEKQADHLHRSGIRTVFVSGSTGESHSSTLEERQLLIRRWSEVAKGSGLSVLVHVGSNCQLDAISLATLAGKLNLAGIAALAPSYFKPGSAEDLLRFLAPVARAAHDLPFYYYDIPALTGVQLSLIEILANGPRSIPNLSGIKYTNQDPIQLQECLRFNNGTFDILYGIDEALLTSLVLGVRGAVGSSYNFAAPLYHRLIDAYETGEIERARELQSTSIRLIRLLARYGYMAAAKHVMKMHGVDVGSVRPPLRPMSVEQSKSLERELDESGLWEAIQG